MLGLREVICLKVTLLLGWQSAWGLGAGLFWTLPAASSGHGVGYFLDSVSVSLDVGKQAVRLQNPQGLGETKQIGSLSTSSSL